MAHADSAYILRDRRRPAIFAGANTLRGRETAVKEAYLDHQDILLKWLTKILGDREAAQDVAQASFLNLWVYAAHRPVKRPKSLLFKTAKNLAMNELRRRRRFFKCNIMSCEIPEIDVEQRSASNDPSPEDAAALKQQTTLILRIIDEMPSRQRAAFKLHRFNKLSYKEIAAEIGVSESSVGKYIMEALKTLRRALV